MVDTKKYQRVGRVKLLKILQSGHLNTSKPLAKIEKEVTLYEARYPLKSHLYIFNKEGKRTQVFVTSGSFYNLPQGKYIRRATKADARQRKKYRGN